MGMEIKMKKVLYIVSGYEIKEVEIERETEKCYWVKDGYLKGLRQLKDSYGKNAFSTLKEAQDFFKSIAPSKIEMYTKDIKRLQKLVEDYKNTLKEIN